MRKLLKDNYDAIVARGKITTETTDTDFRLKLIEETSEVHREFYKDKTKMAVEIVDVINTCNNWLIHNGYDPDKELEKCLQHQLTRKD